MCGSGVPRLVRGHPGCADALVGQSLEPAAVKDTHQARGQIDVRGGRTETGRKPRPRCVCARFAPGEARGKSELGQWGRRC